MERKMRPAILPQASEDGVADKHMLGLMALQLWFCEMAGMLLRFKLKPERCNEQFLRQWADITGKLRKPTGALHGLMLADPSWELRMRTMGHATVYHWLLRDQLLTWASTAKAQIKEKSADQTKETRAQYHR